MCLASFVLSAHERAGMRHRAHIGSAHCARARLQVDIGKSYFRTKSTVGIMLNDCVVDNLVVGGPAFNSRQIQQGDSILKIDGKAVSP